MKKKETKTTKTKKEKKEEPVINDVVNHPSHYKWLKDVIGVEVIDITRHFNYNKGTALAYIMRSGRKTERGYTRIQKEIEDLKKAIFHLNNEIEKLEEEEMKLKNIPIISEFSTGDD